VIRLAAQDLEAAVATVDTAEDAIVKAADLGPDIQPGWPL